jgi:hypothetical protein
MLLLALLASGAADWIPMRWPAADPQSLRVLDGTPVNCILLESAAWSLDLLAEAKRRRVSALAVVHPGTDAAGVARRAAAMPFDGMVLEGDFDSAARDDIRSLARRPVIELTSRAQMRFDSDDPVIGTTQGVWAGLEIEHGGKVMSAPTSAPWIDTNSGFLRFAHASTKSVIWIATKPPPGNIYRPERYVQSIGDAEICGARWIIALDDGLQARLLKQEAKAVRDWQFIVRHLLYFREHDEAHRWNDWSRFAVLEDSETGALLSFGLLDMLSAQRTAVRPLPLHGFSEGSLKETTAVLNVHPATLNAEQVRLLDDFRKSGGTVLDPPAGWHLPPVPDGEFIMGRPQADALQPLWEITYKATLRKNFGSRTFNTAGVLSNTVASPDGRTAIVYLVNYTDFPAESVTVHALGSWKRVRIFEPAGVVKELDSYPVAGGTGVDLEALATVAAVQFER